MKTLSVKAPASTANLGPAFDSLGLALDLWNESSFELVGNEISINIKGEGKDSLAKDQSNLILQAFSEVYLKKGEAIPKGIQLICHNRIPLSSGLGSSSAAIATGLIAANEYLGKPYLMHALLNIGARMEGHADNLAAALIGGLLLVINKDEEFDATPQDCPKLRCVILLPNFEISTSASRKSLSKKVDLVDTVFNIGHSMYLLQALKDGDIRKMQEAMKDRIHQEQRMKLIPGAEEAMAAASEAGGAVALSGAGPSLIAFVEEGREKAVTEALRAPFAQREISTQQFMLTSTKLGANIIGD